jgi:hypothetical protein
MPRKIMTPYKEPPFGFLHRLNPFISAAGLLGLWLWARDQITKHNKASG